MGSEGHLRAISGLVWRVISEGHLGSILRSIWVNSGPYLRNLIISLKKAFIWPWVGPSAKYILNMGPGRSWEGTGYSPSTHHPVPTRPHHPGYTPCRRHATSWPGTPCCQLVIVSWGSYPSANSLKDHNSQGSGV